MSLGERCVAVVALAAALLSVSSGAAVAKHGFRRVYPHSRVVVVRHQGLVKKVPTNVSFAAYDERRLRLLPNWPVGARSNNLGQGPRWHVVDRNQDLLVTPDGFRVPPSRPNPVRVTPLRVEDHEDSWRGRE